MWVVSLDLSKAFDRVHWPALWKSLLEQGISEHMVGMISKLYDGQFGEVIGSSGRSRKFNITWGVRQGCVMSPRLLLQFAIRKWRLKVGDLGFDLLDGMPHLIDLRFADDILFFRFFFSPPHLFPRLSVALTVLLGSLHDRLWKWENCWIAWWPSCRKWVLC